MSFVWPSYAACVLLAVLIDPGGVGLALLLVGALVLLVVLTDSARAPRRARPPKGDGP